MRLPLAPRAPLERSAASSRDAVMFAYIAQKKSAGVSMAELLDNLSARCGGPRGVNSTLNRLRSKKRVVLGAGKKEHPLLGRKVGLYFAVEGASL